MKRDTIILIIISVIIVLLVGAMLSCLIIDDDPELAGGYYYKLHDLNSLFTTIHELYSPTVSQPIDIPVLYINLDRCPERRAWMEKQGVQYGFEPIRVTGVDGDKDPSIIYRNSYDNLTRSEIGCTLSHLRAIHLAYNLELTYALIVEDDASFVTCPYWSRTLTQYVTHAPSDWTILRLFSGGSYQEEGEEYLTFSSNEVMSTAYILNRTGMKNILDRCVHGEEYILEPPPFVGRADDYIFLVGPLQKMYYINPPLIIPDNRNLRSIIHDDHTPVHYRLSSKALSLYLDRVLTPALTQYKPNPLCIEMLYEPMIHRYCTRTPTYVDVVVSVDEGTSHSVAPPNWLKQILACLSRSRYRLFVYVRGQTVPDWKDVDEITTLNAIGGSEAAFAYHVHGAERSSEHILCLDDRCRVTDVVQVLTSVHSQNQIEDLKHYTHPTYPPSTLRTVPSSLRSLDRWYEIVTQTKIGLCHCSKVLLTSSHTQHDKDVWYRILLSLSYAREPETARHLRKVWCGLFSL